MTALLTSVLWKGAVVLAAAALAALALRRAPAAARHGVWAAALVALLALPVLEAAGPAWRLPVLPAAAPPSAVPAPPPPPPAPPAPAPPPPAPPPPPEPPGWASGPTHAGGGAVARGAPTAVHDRQMAAFDQEMAAFDREMTAFDAEMERFGAEAQAVASPPAPALGAGGAGWAPWLAGAWALGALAVALGWAGAVLAARRLVAAARPEADDEWAVLFERARRLSGVGRGVRLLRSGRLDVPVAWGWGGGAVVLPDAADGWDEDRREAVLLHELAHLRRRDAWTQALAQAALAVHWPNPAAWWAYRRFLDAREEACDDAVIRGGARPSSYAAHLVGVARGLRGRGADRRGGAALAAVAPMARPSGLEGRVRSVLDPARRRHALGRAALAATAALAVAVVLPLAAMRPVAQAADRPAPLSDAVAAVVVEAPAPPAPPAGSVHDVLADTLDALREAEEALEHAEAEVARAADRVARAREAAMGSEALATDDPALALRTHALDQAAEALASVDVEATVEAAFAGVRHAYGDDAEWQAEMEEALREARAGLREGQAEIAEARAELAAEVREARAEARAGWTAPPAPPTPPRPDARAPRPAPRPAARSAPAPTGAVDWEAIDRARRAASR